MQANQVLLKALSRLASVVHLIGPEVWLHQTLNKAFAHSVKEMEGKTTVLESGKMTFLGILKSHVKSFGHSKSRLLISLKRNCQLTVQRCQFIVSMSPSKSRKQTFLRNHPSFPGHYLEQSQLCHSLRRSCPANYYYFGLIIRWGRCN